MSPSQQSLGIRSSGVSRRDFSEQFRIDAVKRMLTEGPGTPTNATYVSIAKDLGIYDTSLHEWRRKFEGEARRQLEAEADATTDPEGTEEVPDDEETPVITGLALEDLLEEPDEAPDDVSTVEIVLGLPTIILPLSRSQMDRLLERIRVQLEETFGPSNDEQ